MIPCILGALLLCLACAMQAGIYTYTGAEGNHVYTDQPPNGRKVQRVELVPGSSMVPPGIRYRPPATPLEVKPPAYQLLRILSLEPGATLHASSDGVIVTATSESTLLSDHHYRLLLGGKFAGAPGRSPVFSLKNLDHGIHQVAAEIIDGDGMTIESTPSQPFHLHRVSTTRQPLLEVDTPLVSAIWPGERQPSFLCPLCHGRNFLVFFPTLLTKTPPVTSTRQIGAITRTTFYTAPTSGHRSSPRTFPAHLWPAPQQKKCAFSTPDLFFAFPCPALGQLPAMPTDALHRLSLDSLATVVILPNGELRLKHMNPATEVLLAVSGQRSHGQSISELFTESPETLNPLRQAAEQAHPFTKRGATPTPIIGVSITVDYVVTPTLDRNETLLPFRVRPHDRLMWTTREEVRLSKQETIKLLVCGLTHKIKNPLGGIRGAAQLLSRESPEESLRDYTNVITEEAGRPRNLADRMLGSNKLPNPASTNVHEVLERVSNLVEAESQGSVTLVRDHDPSIPDLLLDREQMVQTVLDIVRNAVQTVAGQNNPCLNRATLHSRTLRQSTIGYTRYRLACKVETTDDGPGIPAELQETVSYPMVSDRSDGIRLGLATAQNIISQR